MNHHTKKETHRDDPTNFHTCDFCPYRTKSISTMINHAKEHDSSPCPSELFDCSESTPDMYKCGECAFETHLMVNLHQHIKITHESALDIEDEKLNLKEILNRYSCSNCSLQTYSWLVLMEHVHGRCPPKVYLVKNSKFQCVLCLFKVKTKHNLRKHILKNHAPYEINNEIKNQYTSGHSIQQYVFDMNAEDIKWYTCEQCPFKTKYKTSFSHHVKTRHAVLKHIKWHTCEQCTYKSKERSNLKTHILAHHTASEDIKWYQCEQCSHKSKRRTDLRIHIMRRHTAPENIRWFKCDSCSHQAKKLAELKSHILRKHTAVEDIEWLRCERCSYKAKKPFELKSHMLRIHTVRKDREWLACYSCTFKTRHEGALSHHRLKFHKDLQLEENSSD